MTSQHGGPTAAHALSDAQVQVSLRSPGELADALPYLLGFHPDDSVVLVALHGERGRFGGRMRVAIPAEPEAWAGIADQLAGCLVTASSARGDRPDGALLFLCRDPGPGEDGAVVVEQLRPFAQLLRTACGEREVPVYEALCVSAGRWWSYVCRGADCCPPEGSALSPPGTSQMAAAAAFAGLRVRGSLTEIESRLVPPAAAEDGPEEALDAAYAGLLPRMLRPGGAEEVREETLALAGRLVARLRAAGTGPAGRAEKSGVEAAAAADARDDALVGLAEAAAVVFGLQDRLTRDRAAEWMEGEDAEPALRLWRALARRCVGPYAHHAAAPLTLAGWVAWSVGDEPTARVALGRALDADPDYVFAQLLHRACNEGLDPEPLRQCMREERRSRRSPGVAGSA
ncbi:MAG TPA: DUF4192 domain-containing protein [Streptomyces sp.]|nr:DUF4192 domain-containing protein [Streptomyces sp.]